MTEILLVTGSRIISEAGLAYARKVVKRAHQLEYEIVVGDASGIDDAVMRECHTLGVPCTVVGAYSKLRRRTPSCEVVQHAGSYIQRDRYMAERCDLCLAIWNGQSRGTKATYDFAVGFGKPAWLKTFDSEDSRSERPANEGGVAMTQVTIYTDGACSGNPGPAGWAAILMCGEHQKEVVGGAAESTNNRAEIMAVVTGLEALKFACQVTIHTDSQYVIGALSLGWKRKANHDLLAQADALLAKHDVTFVKVKGHDGNPLNERCDQLAKAEVERQRSQANTVGSARVDFCQLSGGNVVVTEMRREGQRSIPLGEPTVVTRDLASLLTEYEANGYTVRRWDSGARAWLGKPWPIRTASQIMAMRTRNPYSQVDFAFDG